MSPRDLPDRLSPQDTLLRPPRHHASRNGGDRVALIGLGHSPVAEAVLLAGWGLIGTAAPVGWWTWLSKALPDDAEAGGGLMVAVVQLAITGWRLGRRRAPVRRERLPERVRLQRGSALRIGAPPRWPAPPPERSSEEQHITTTDQNGSFAGKVAFVTGAANGTGHAAASAFACEGASMAVADVSGQGIQETARLVEQAGGHALAIQCDVSREGDLKAALDKVVEAFGRLDFAFNNAGVEQPVETGGRPDAGRVGPAHRHQPPRRVPVHTA